MSKVDDTPIHKGEHTPEGALGQSAFFFFFAICLFEITFPATSRSATKKAPQ